MSKLFERLLEKRGLDRNFLQPEYESLSDAFLLPDMDAAVQRLLRAVEKQERVLIYGDYDVDGVTASTIMHKTLKLIGIKNIEIMLPDRFIDGYGMSQRLVEYVKEQGDFAVVVTVDCGSNNREIIEQLKTRGVDVIVTDHHEISGEIPKALAVINPKRSDFGESQELKKLRELCGAGVAFMVARALVKEGRIPDGQEKWLLDLAMIGTICDNMLMRGDNRIICKYGMLVLSKTRNVGLLELMRVAGVKNINTEAIGFQLGPRLNAAGRMKNAELALRLLMTESKVEAAGLAEELNNLNLERKKQQEKAVEEACDGGIVADPVIVVGGEWHEGILGIIAGRLTEKYCRPSFVLGKVDDAWKGSGRSFGDFNLAMALDECRDLLVSGGGHAGAAGVKLAPENLGKFRERINNYYISLGLENQERFLDTREDLVVGNTKNLNHELVSELSELEPYGAGNAEPVFLLESVTVLEARKMGAKENHLRLLIKDENEGLFKLVAFYAKEEWLLLRPGEKINVWLNLTVSEWNGTTTAEGRIVKLEKIIESY